MTPGQVAYEKFNTGLGSSVYRWSEVDPGVAEAWESISQAVIDHARGKLEVKEVLPKLFVDGMLSTSESTVAVNQDATILNLQLTIPAVHLVRGSQGPTVNKLLDEARRPGAVVRIAVTNDIETKAQFARLDKDGSVRQFLEGEGTW